MKKAILLICIIIFFTIAFAHEFWLLPQKFFYSIREVANIRFLVGENFTGENWTGNKEKIKELIHYSPTGNRTDLSSGLSSNTGDSLQLPLSEEGTHMIIFQSKNSFLNLESEKFNAYIHEDGLTHTELYRKIHNETDSYGKEYYQRSVKTILQVGGLVTDLVLKPSILPLDIVPEENPYSTPLLDSKDNARKVKFRVLFHGEPLNNALVKVWYHTSKTHISMDTLRTNKKGWIITERHSGPFMVSCVYMERNLTDTVADWQSYWASLSFEYSQYFSKPPVK